MLDRRAFLLSGLAMYGASARELFAAGPALQNPKFLHVAVYARRLLRRSQRRRRRPVDAPRDRSAERRRHAGQPIEVQWQIATDDRLSRVVKSGKAIASPDWAHIRCTSRSRASSRTRWYWYQFRAGNEVSPDRPHANVSRARSPTSIGFASPSRRASTSKQVSTRRISTWPRKISISSCISAITSTKVAGSGQLRAQARGRRADDGRRLPQPLRAVPQRSGAARRARRVPVSRRLGRSRGRQQLRGTASGSRRRRSSSSRCGAPPRTRRTTSTCRCGAARLPKGALLQLYRPFTYGTLASISMLDTRQYRTDQPCGDNVQLLCDGSARSARDAAGRSTGKVADEPARSLAGGMESPGAADSDGEARSVRRARAPLLDGQVGRLRAEPIAPAALPRRRESRRIR